MAGALPPGAWWEYATAGTAPPRPEAYGINAGQQKGHCDTKKCGIDQGLFDLSKRCKSQVILKASHTFGLISQKIIKEFK